MVKRTKGRKRLQVEFDREIPAVLLVPVLTKSRQNILAEALLRQPVDVSGSEVTGSYVARFEAVAALLGVPPETEIPSLFIALVRKVFPGFSTLPRDVYENSNLSRWDSRNPAVQKWYLRTIQLRVDGWGQTKARAKAAAEIFRIHDPETARSRWKNAMKPKKGSIAFYDELIARYGFQQAAPIILDLGKDLLAS